jgi:hypothetical protein
MTIKRSDIDQVTWKPGAFTHHHNVMSLVKILIKLDVADHFKLARWCYGARDNVEEQ